MMSHLPHAPGQSSALDWASTELFLSLSLNNEAVRRIEGTPSSMGGQQSQQQPSQPHQHTRSHLHPQQSRTLRWGSLVNSMAGSRAGSPERSALSFVTTSINNVNSSPSEGGSSNSVVPSSSSPVSGFASPFQHLFKATIKPFTALAGHHGHIHRPPHPQPLSTTSLMGLQSTSMAGTGSGISAGRSSVHTPDLSSTYPPSGADSISSSVPPSTPVPQNETNGFITSSPSSHSLADNVTLGPSSSSSFNPGLESNPTYPSTSTSASISRTVVQPECQDRVFRAFNVVPDYSIASRGFIGGVPPLSSMHGLPSYEEAEAQRRKREAAQVLKDGDMESQTQMQMQTQTQTLNQEKMKKERSMSEPDLAGRFGHAGVRFEAEVGTSQSMDRGPSGDVGIMQQLQDGDGYGDDGNDDDMGGADPIQMYTKKARP